jgi:O-antigen/teichoic acid export membrane protein
MNVVATLKRHMAGSGMGAELIRSLVGSAGLRLVGMGFTFLIGVQLARGLGVAGFGVYGVAMSVVSLFSMPAEFGFSSLLIREVAANHVNHNWGRLRGIISWTNKTALRISLLVLIAIILWIGLTKKNFSEPIVGALLAGVLMIPLGVLGRLKGAILLGFHQPLKGQIPDVVMRPLIFSMLLFAAYLLSYNLTPALAMFLGTISAGLALWIAYLLLRNILPPEIQTADAELDSRSWWKSAFPMAVTEGMRAVQGNIAIVIVSALVTASSAGIFRIASSVSMIVTMPLTLFLVIGSPLISRLYAQGDMLRLQRLLTGLSVGMTLCVILLTLPFIYSGTHILSHVFGYEFASANTPLLIMCIGSILFSAFGASVVLLNMCGHEQRVTFAFAVSLVTLLITIVPLVKLFRENGAAIASSLAMLTGNIIMWLEARRKLGLDASVFSIIKR